MMCFCNNYVKCDSVILVILPISVTRNDLTRFPAHVYCAVTLPC